MDGLPTPRTTSEELLVALILEVRGMRAELIAARGGETAGQSATGSVVVQEPVQSKAQPTPARRPARRT